LIEEAKKQQKAFFMNHDALRIQDIVATLKNKEKPTKNKSKKDENF